MFSTPVALARSNPATKTSYSTSLFVIGKSRRIMHSILSPSRVWSTTPAPPACLFEDPSIWTLHCTTTSTPWLSMKVNSAMKSATTCPFIAVRGRYHISNSLSSTAYNTVCPATSGLLMVLLRGLSVKTTIVYAWKYGLSFRAAITNANVNFSIWRYLSSAPQNPWLVK